MCDSGRLTPMSSGNKKGRPESELQAQPTKVQIAIVAATLALLAGLVVLLLPARLRFRPAALVKYPAGCIKLQRNFIPTNVTAVSDPAISSLSPQKKDRILLRVNMKACTCGCAASIISCHLRHPQCPTAKNLLRQAIAQAGH